MSCNMPPVILASASPRRKYLLKRWGVKYKAVPSKVSEKIKTKTPSSIVRILALRKAMSVAGKVKNGIVIGADTIVVLNGRIIGKPKGPRDAQGILGSLNGSFHRVYSGIAVIDAQSGKKYVGYEMSRVKMRKLSESEVKKLAVKHLDKAGAYAVQEKSDAFVEKIEGDYFNVVGLPYGLTRKYLGKFGIKLKKERACYK